MPALRKYPFDDDYFEIIDTEDKAYYLGLLLADGNVYSARNRVQITLVKKDEYILKKFAKCIKYKGNIYLDRGKYSKLILPSKKMCSDLAKLGCHPNKGKGDTPATLPDIDDKLVHHLIRGYFDGDGHISKNKKLKNPYYNINITGSVPLITKVKGILEDNQMEVSKLYTRPDKTSVQLVVKNKSVGDFVKYLYKDAKHYLKRKEKIYEGTR